MPDHLRVCNACCGPGFGCIDGFTLDSPAIGGVQSCMCVNCACLVSPGGCMVPFLPNRCPCGGCAIVKHKGVEQSKPMCTATSYCCIYFATVVCCDDIQNPVRAPQICALLCIKCTSGEDMSGFGLCHDFNGSGRDSFKLSDSIIVPAAEGSPPSSNSEMAR